MYRQNSDREQSQIMIPSTVRVTIRSYKKDEYIVRFVNYDETATKNFGLFQVSELCSNLLLQQIAGIEKLNTEFCQLQEVSLSANQPYTDVINKKQHMHEEFYSFTPIFSTILIIS